MTTTALVKASKKVSPADNNILAALPRDAYNRLLPHLHLESLPLGKTIYESGVKMKSIYFPLPGCIISLLYVLENGASAEIAVVGKEGMVGIVLFMGGETTPVLHWCKVPEMLIAWKATG